MNTQFTHAHFFRLSGILRQSGNFSRQFLFSILLLLPVLTRVFAQTPVSGNQSGLWDLSGSPYLITGQVTVPAGDSLIIQPGVQILFQGNYRFRVNGYLRAVGSESDSIWFMPDSGVSAWGGLRFTDASPGSELAYCHFSHGHATGDWPDNSGGGVSLWSTDVTIRHSVFLHNSADHHGGGLFCWNANPLVEDCRFSDNSAVYDGGAIYLYFSGGTFNRCEISYNNTGYHGAALCCESAYTPRFFRCLMHHNQAGTQAGGVQANLSELILTNCTVASNGTAGWGGGIYLSYTNLYLTNSIVWGNTGYGNEIYLDIMGQASVYYSDVPGNFGGTGNLNSNPMFTQPAAGDFRLSAGSPCIDSGTAFLVNNGDTLVALDSTQYSGSAPDMGALEYEDPSELPHGNPLPAQFSLMANYPNPFNPGTTIPFTVPAGGEKQTQITLQIFDPLGRIVATLVNGPLPPGEYRIFWNAGEAPAGMYFYRLTAGKFHQTRHMLLLK